MSKLNDILDSGLFVDSDGQADYRSGKVKQEIKDLMLELIGDVSDFDSASVQEYKTELRQKVNNL